VGRDRSGAYRPWERLESLLTAPPEPATGLMRHPRRSVLRAYREGTLPDRPDAWSRERAEALAAGTLTDWTRWEVAAHVATCTRCRRRLARLGEATAPWTLPWLARIRAALQRPRATTAVWALAGAQAVAIAAILLWGGPADRPVLKPDGLPTLNQSSSVAFPAASPAYSVAFEPDAPWGEVSEWLHSLNAEIRGPDEDGRYVLVGDGLSADLLVRSAWIRCVDAAEGGDEE